MAGTRRRWRLPVLALPSIELSIRATSRRGMLGARGAAFAWNWRAGRLAGRKLGTTARDKDSEKSMSSLSKLSFFRRFAALHVVAAPLLGQGIPLQDWYAYPDRHSEWRWFSARLLARDPEPHKARMLRGSCRQRCTYKEAKLAASRYQNAKQSLLLVKFANWLVCPDEFQSFVLQPPDG